MGLSDPDITNPSKRYFNWKGGADKFKDEEGNVHFEGGKVVYWDKDLEENVLVELPLRFIVLEVLSTITGFNEAKATGYRSNDVKNSSKEIMVVRTKQGVVARGTYPQIKELGMSGLKYGASIYIAFFDETGELTIGHLLLSGAALGQWMEFTKKVNIKKCAVMLEVNPKVQTKGTVNFFVPKFSSIKIKDSTLEAAKEMHLQLKEYFVAYFNRDPDTEPVVDEEDDEPPADIHNIAGVDDQEKLDDGTPIPADKPEAKPPVKKVNSDGDVPLEDVEF